MESTDKAKHRMNSSKLKWNNSNNYQSEQQTNQSETDLYNFNQNITKLLTFRIIYMFNREPFKQNLHISHIYTYHNGASLWIGDYSAAVDQVLLTRLKIRAILTASDGMNINYDKDSTYLIVRAQDAPSYDIRKHFSQSNSFIISNLNNNRNVLVHCAAGISRSVTLVTAFFIKNLNLSFSQSLALIQSRRPKANPNYGFVQQLKKYQSSIKYKKTLTQINSQGQSNKEKNINEMLEIITLRKKQSEKIRYQFPKTKNQPVTINKNINNQKFLLLNKSFPKRKRSKKLVSVSQRGQVNVNLKKSEKQDLKYDLKQRIYKKLHKKNNTQTQENILLPKIQSINKQKIKVNNFF